MSPKFQRKKEDKSSRYKVISVYQSLAVGSLVSGIFGHMGATLVSSLTFNHKI